MMSVSVTKIRQAHKDLTRERILDAAVESMAETMNTALSTSDVAARAGVTERTIYRHFLTREALAQAVWPRVVARLQSQQIPGDAAELVRMPLSVFPELDRSEALVRAAVYSEVARQASLQTNSARQTAMQACVREALPDLDAQSCRRRAAVALAICSAYGWAVLKDFGGLEGGDVGRAASEALAILLGYRPASNPRAKSPRVT